MKLIADIMFKGKCLQVLRDKHGKFHVDGNARVAQKKLTAEEIVRYLCNMMRQDHNHID